MQTVLFLRIKNKTIGEIGIFTDYFSTMTELFEVTNETSLLLITTPTPRLFP